MWDTVGYCGALWGIIIHFFFTGHRIWIVNISWKTWRGGPKFGVHACETWRLKEEQNPRLCPPHVLWGVAVFWRLGGESVCLLKPCSTLWRFLKASQKDCIFQFRLRDTHIRVVFFHRLNCRCTISSLFPCFNVGAVRQIHHSNDLFAQ